MARGLSCSAACGNSPERRLSSCGAPAELLQGTWNLSGSGIKPVSPELAGGFFTTEPPGKPPGLFLE